MTLILIFFADLTKSLSTWSKSTFWAKVEIVPKEKNIGIMGQMDGLSKYMRIFIDMFSVPKNLKFDTAGK